jgi:hypothetical protein
MSIRVAARAGVRGHDAVHAHGHIQQTYASRNLPGSAGQRGDRALRVHPELPVDQHRRAALGQACIRFEVAYRGRVEEAEFDRRTHIGGDAWGLARHERRGAGREDVEPARGPQPEGTVPRGIQPPPDLAAGPRERDEFGAVGEQVHVGGDRAAVGPGRGRRQASRLFQDDDAAETGSPAGLGHREADHAPADDETIGPAVQLGRDTWLQRGLRLPVEPVYPDGNTIYASRSGQVVQHIWRTGGELWLEYLDPSAQLSHGRVATPAAMERVIAALADEDWIVLRDLGPLENVGW